MRDRQAGVPPAARFSGWPERPNTEDAALKDLSAHDPRRDALGVRPRPGSRCLPRRSATAAKFHSYSLGNLLLIRLQAPQATRVAGFRSWQSLGRQVRKGERGIAILAPCTYRPKTSSCTTDSTRQALQEDERGGPAAPASRGGQLRGFRVVHVFDVAQTEGEPLPEATPWSAGTAPAPTATPTPPAEWCGSAATSRCGLVIAGGSRWPRPSSAPRDRPAAARALLESRDTLELPARRREREDAQARSCQRAAGAAASV